MNEDLGFSDTIYGIGAGIYFIGYFVFEVPSNLIMEKIGARIWIAWIMITWASSPRPCSSFVGRPASTSCAFSSA